MSSTPLSASDATASAPPIPRAALRRWSLAYACYTVCTNTGFTQAVWVLYLAAHGYSPFAIGLFEMAFHIAKFVAEIPTGIFADLAGRRASLVAACLCGLAGELLFLVPSAPLLALGLACSGVSYAFRGGAESSLVWGLVERAGAGDQGNRYARLFSHMLVLGLMAMAFGQMSSGFLSHADRTLPFLIQGVAMGLGIVPLLFLPEQRVTQVRRPHPLAHLREGLRAVRHDGALLGLLLLSGLEAAVFTTTNYFTQLYFSQLGLTLAVIGVVYGVSSIGDFLFTASAPSMMRAVPRCWLLRALVAGIVLGLLAMCTRQPLIGLAGFLLLFHGADALCVPVLSTYLNERAPAAQRATVLSLDTGLFSALMIVLFPLFGLGVTAIPFSVAYLGLAAAFGLGASGILALIGTAERGRTRALHPPAPSPLRRRGGAP